MADAVESMFSASNMVPWHGLGTIVKDALTADEALTQSGQDWLVEKVPMEMTWDGKQVFIPGRFITVRNRDGRALGVVKSEYTPLQNHEAFSFFDEIVSRKEAIYETAGVLNDGARVWILARLPGEIYVKTRRGAEDITNKYVVIANSHDGSTGVQAKVTPIRVVCNNTLTAAMRGGSFNVRHTKNVADRVQQAAKVMGFTNKMYEQLQVAYQSMADKEINGTQVLAYFEACLAKTAKVTNDFGDNEVDDEAPETTDESKKREPRALRELYRLYEEGAGADMAAGTLWGAYNAVTEYVDHKGTYRGDNAANSRLNSVWFGGAGNVLKQKGFSEAVALLK